MRVGTLAVALVALASCGSESRPRNADNKSTAEVVPPPAAVKAAPAEPLGACGASSSRQDLGPGLELLTLVPTKRPAVPTADTCLRVLRADMSLFRLEVGAKARGGAALSAPQWAKRRGARAVINASMFHGDGASTGLFVDGGKALVSKVNSKFGAFLATAPKTVSSPEVILWGRSCPGQSVETLRANYDTVIQNYRLLACDGSAIAWKDEKVYSAAAVALDREGRVLFIHSRAPYKMSTFTELLTDPAMKLDLAAAMYVEGGPEASLFVEANGRKGLFVGSYETAFLENDDNAAAWPLPNVLMLVNQGT